MIFIGEKGLWNGFIPLGVNLFEIEDRNEILILLEKLDSNEIIFISDFVAKLIDKDLDDLYKKNLNIIIMPSFDFNGKERELYFKRLKKVIEKAMGVDLLTD